MLKWNFTAPRAEFVEQLKEQMRPCFGKTLHTNLFHADFKYHLIGISSMQQVLKRYSVTRHRKKIHPMGKVSFRVFHIDDVIVRVELS